VLPDGDEPLVHLYAEGETPAESEELETELRSLVVEVIEREEIGAAR
jgi:phosphomannomutase